MTTTGVLTSASFKTSASDSVTWISTDGDLSSIVEGLINYPLPLAKDLVKTLASLLVEITEYFNYGDFAL